MTEQENVFPKVNYFYFRNPVVVREYDLEIHDSKEYSMEEEVARYGLVKAICFGRELVYVQHSNYFLLYQLW